MSKGNMQKIARKAIVINILLVLLYVLSSYFLWSSVNWWNTYDIKADWSPILVTPIYPHLNPMPSFPMSIQPLPNIPFLSFWLIPAANLYFINKLIEAKKQSQTNKEEPKN